MNGMNPDKSGPPEPDACGEPWQSPNALMPLLSGAGGITSKTHGKHETRDQLQALVRTVETQIIPRLMLLHRIGPQRSTPAAHNNEPLPSAQVLEFTALVMKEHDAAAAYVDGLLLHGVPLQNIYLDLLGPAARRMGELWEADLCDFTDVTLGLGRLQRVLRDLAADTRPSQAEGVPSHRALLMPVPGEQHTFGLNMVKEFFRQAGWLVWHETPESPQRLLSLVHEHWFDLIGVSIGGERHIDAMHALIRDVRKRAQNKAMLVLVGGPLLFSHPDLASLVGADASATDARQAMLQVDRLMALR